MYIVLYKRNLNLQPGKDDIKRFDIQEQLAGIYFIFQNGKNGFDQKISLTSFFSKFLFIFSF